MGSSLTVTTPGLNASDLMAANSSYKSLGADKLSTANQAKARKSAEDFEAVFLNSMFQHMFAGVTGEGPMGGSGATGTWRSFLTEQYSKNIVKAGGIGIADQVYKSLIAHQEARS